MLKEEKKLRKFIYDKSYDEYPGQFNEPRKRYYRLIADYGRSVRFQCADIGYKEAVRYFGDENVMFAAKIAAAIRGKK